MSPLLLLYGAPVVSPSAAFQVPLKVAFATPDGPARSVANAARVTQVGGSPVTTTVNVSSRITAVS